MLYIKRGAGAIGHGCGFAVGQNQKITMTEFLSKLKLYVLDHLLNVAAQLQKQEVTVSD